MIRNQKISDRINRINKMFFESCGSCLKFFVLVSFLVLYCQLVNAPASLAMDRTTDGAKDGLALARKVFGREDGKDAYAKMHMVLVDKRGKTRSRFMISATKDFGPLSKTYTRFTEPASIDGTGFLTWENEDRDDDQFLYLPALRRVRRIVSKQKDSRFVNSDYTYEDMQKRKPAKDNHRILGSQVIDGYDCWVLESVPKDPDDSQYGKRVGWIVKDIFLPMKTEYYDKRGQLVKIFSARGLKDVDGIWTIMQSEMNDLKRKHRTFMKTVGIKYNGGIPDRVFTTRYLQDSK